MSLLSTADWADRIFTGGWDLPARPGTIDITEPATGQHLGSVGRATEADVAPAARTAAAAGRAWAAAPFPERAAALRRAADAFRSHADEIADWIVREAGSSRAKAALEVAVAAAECEEAAALPAAPTGELLPSTQPRLSMARRIPVGVVGVISPFNFPLILSIRSIAPALALGNAVLLKPDPRTPVSGGVVLARVFEEAGLPAGLLHCLPGGADVGAAIVRDPAVRVVSFTGSTAAGRAVGALASEQLTRAHLELGGNSALIVLDDADMEAAASCGAWGNFLHQGQICMAVGRHLVHESRYEEYLGLLAKKAEQLTVGDPFREPVALGPLIDDRQLGHVVDVVERSVAAGARVVTGGTHRGRFYRPTVLADCGPSVPAWDEEVFGPVACVRPYRDDDEAAALAADSPYGLSLGILTADTARGLALAERIPSGMVHINDQTVNDDPNAPFGGLAASGFGRVGGARANLDAFTETQWLTLRGDTARYPF
ncbi:aldehyde dehydrogenase family protein [Streptomyces sp. BRA346]|uniref:aldehyde dehydrogenase family protein n=1 Tax=Streptomyces sp. BRA346 TaxID=2878199 RepID=UPI00406301FA